MFWRRRKPEHRVIILKDPDMATIKERLDALEAAAATWSGSAAAADVAALETRVTAIEDEIGVDPTPPEVAASDTSQPSA